MRYRDDLAAMDVCLTGIGGHHQPVTHVCQHRDHLSPSSKLVPTLPIARRGRKRRRSRCARSLGSSPPVGALGTGLRRLAASVGAAERRCIVVRVDSAIVARELVVELGRRRILCGLTFGVPAGQVTGLLGPSGCGKTTLMRCVVGVAQITSGTVEVLGLPAGSSPLRHRVGYVTQGASVYTDLTARENVRYFAALYGVSAASADAALADVALADMATRKVATLSGGERARVSLACALLARPDVLVLDEPTVGLDPVLRRDLWDRFHALATAGTTLFVSSHVMDEASRCDRLLLLREGSLVADASPAALEAATGATDVEGAFLRLVRQRAPLPRGSSLRPPDACCDSCSATDAPSPCCWSCPAHCSPSPTR